eukprot:2539286-Pyramimonas_sp.AAC.1
MEGGWCSTCGSGLSAVHICLTTLQELHGWRAGRSQNVTLPVAPRTFVFALDNSFKDSYG